MGLTVLALTSGFALAQLSLGGTSTAQQGSQTTTVQSVQGLGWTGTILETVPNSPSNTSGCGTLAGCSVTSAGANNCVGSVSGTLCKAGDFVEAVQLSTQGVAFVGTVHITTYIELTDGTTYTGATLNYTNTGTDFETITQLFDIGNISTGPAAVSAVTVVATVS